MSEAMMDTRVLVVDDALEIRRLIEVLIKRRARGWRVVARAADGEEGVELARVEQPDLVLLDISMPGMDGIEALPLVRHAAPGTVIVMLSGYPDTAVRDRVMAAGADGLLGKDDLFYGLVPALESVLTTVRDQRSQMTAPG